jgi:hypothetical protein
VTIANLIHDAELKIIYDIVYVGLFGMTRREMCVAIGVDPDIPHDQVGALEDYLNTAALNALGKVDAGMIRWVKTRMVYQMFTLKGAVEEARRLAALHKPQGDWRYTHD